MVGVKFNLSLVDRFENGRETRHVACRRKEKAMTKTSVSWLQESRQFVVEGLVPMCRGFEAKDVQIGAPFYLAQGVRDVVLFDPDSGEVTHLRSGEERRLASPAEIELACGCLVTV